MKYYGKEKCRILKKIRAEIAKHNEIEWVVSECQHQGDCKGTCPKCEQEVRELEAALARREALGKTVAVVGISASIALSVTGCVRNATGGEPISPPGGMTLPETTTVVTETETPAETDIVVDGEIEVPMQGDPVPDTWWVETETDTEPPLPGEETFMGAPVDDPSPEDVTDTNSVPTD